MRSLQKLTGKSARLKPAKAGLAAFHTLGGQPISCHQSFRDRSLQALGGHGLASGKAPARVPARGLAGIVGSIYGDSAQIWQNQQESLVGAAGST